MNSQEREQVARRRAEQAETIERLRATADKAIDGIRDRDGEITRLKRELWLTDCEEWDGTLHCDPKQPCKACELRREVARLKAAVEARDERQWVGYPLKRCAYCGREDGCASDCPTVTHPLEVA